MTQTLITLLEWLCSFLKEVDTTAGTTRSSGPSTRWQMRRDLTTSTLKDSSWVTLWSTVPRRWEMSSSGACASGEFASYTSVPLRLLFFLRYTDYPLMKYPVSADGLALYELTKDFIQYCGDRLSRHQTRLFENNYIPASECRSFCSTSRKGESWVRSGARAGNFWVQLRPDGRRKSSGYDQLAADRAAWAARVWPAQHPFPQCKQSTWEFTTHTAG